MNNNYLLKIVVGLFIVFAVFAMAILSIEMQRSRLGSGYGFGQIIEGLEDKPDTSIPLNFTSSFCKMNQKSGGGELNTACQKLTQSNCRSTSCCIWAKTGDEEKCLAGGKTGPLFSTSEPPDYYYVNDNCYGKNCP